MRKQSLLMRNVKARHVLADWERELLGATRTHPPIAKAAARRESRRLRISRAARRNGMTYNEFMSGLKLVNLSKDRGHLGGHNVRETLLDSIAEQIKAARGNG